MSCRIPRSECRPGLKSQAICQASARESLAHRQIACELTGLRDGGLADRVEQVRISALVVVPHAATPPAPGGDDALALPLSTTHIEGDSRLASAAIRFARRPVHKVDRGAIGPDEAALSSAVFEADPATVAAVGRLVGDSRAVRVLR